MERFDPFDPDVLDDPAAGYGRLRELGPVHWYDGLGGFYLFTRYDDIAAALRDHQRWSFRWGGGPSRELGGGLFSDPPEHTLFRRMLGPAHSPGAVARMRDAVEAQAVELVEAMVRKGAPANLHDDLAVPLPVNVIAHMLGVPPESRGDFKRWSDETVVAMNSGDPEVSRRVRAVVAEFFGEMIVERQELIAGADQVDEAMLGDTLPDDLVSRLVLADRNIRPMTRSEMTSVLHQQLIGGNETTTSLITNVVLRLIEMPGLAATVRSDPTLIEVAVEESLRFDPPVLGLFRTNDVELVIGDVTVPKDSKALMLYASANRDPRAWDDPDTFRVDRDLGALRRKQLSFGAGIHTCQGALLARMEAGIALRLVLDRLPELRLAGPTRRVQPFLMWGRASMPITWATDDEPVSA